MMVTVHWVGEMVGNLGQGGSGGQVSSDMIKRNSRLCEEPGKELSRPRALQAHRLWSWE